MSKVLEPPLEVVTGTHPLSSVIWLHGLGASGYDFQPIVPQLGLPDSLSVRFVFPHAPDRAVTLNGGMVMPAWYDIYALERGSRVDLEGLAQSASLVEQLVKKEMDRGVPEHRIVLAGFSQGGAVALYYLTQRPASFAGVLALSTYLPVGDADESALRHNRSIPVWMGHGLEDPVVRYEWGRNSASRLVQLGFDVAWHEYPMAHLVSPQEVLDTGAWLTERLSD